MTDGKFAAELRKWRGKRRQKEAAALLTVSIHTFRGWEYGKHVPPDICKKCVQIKMSENQPKE